MSKKVSLYLVQPGLGKTTSVKKHKGLVDFDVGSMRKYFGITDDDHNERWRKTKDLYPALYEIMKVSSKWNDVILTNEPSFVTYVLSRDRNIRAFVVVADTPENWSKRVSARDEDWFAKLLKEKATTWYPGWVDVAVKHDLPLYTLKNGFYFEDILDGRIKAIREGVGRDVKA